MVCVFWVQERGQGRVRRENREPDPWLLVGSENIRSVMSEVRFSWKQSLRQDSCAHDLLKKCPEEKPKRSGGNQTVKGKKTIKSMASGEVPTSA